MTLFRFFLTARHWQLFLLLFGGMLAAQFVGVSSMPYIDGAPGQFRQVMLPFFGMTYVFMLMLVAWQWTLGEFLASIAPPELIPSKGRFRFALLWPILYLPVFVAVVVWNERSPSEAPFIVPLHVLTMYCIFYNLYFVAKSLKLAEQQAPVTFYDYSGPLLLLWFFPVGIWIVQPRINKLVAQSGDVRN